MIQCQNKYNVQLRCLTIKTTVIAVHSIEVRCAHYKSQMCVQCKERTHCDVLFLIFHIYIGKLLYYRSGNFECFRSGDLDMKIALRTTEYLGSETEYVAWSAASDELGFVSTMLKRNPLYGEYSVSLLPS